MALSRDSQRIGNSDSNAARADVETKNAGMQSLRHDLIIKLSRRGACSQLQEADSSPLKRNLNDKVETVMA